jgi:hypothetical protein
VHEVERVFRDRMVSATDMSKFDEFKTGITKKYFEDLGMPNLEQQPLLFTSFMQVRESMQFAVQLQRQKWLLLLLA